MTVTATPGQTFTGVSPVKPLTPVPTPSFTGVGAIHSAGEGATPQGSHTASKPVTHLLAVYEPPANRPVTSGDHIGEQPYSLELIEPGIQGHQVEVYRSKDVREVTYQDVNPLDFGGFHLRVIGLRNPAYSH